MAFLGSLIEYLVKMIILAVIAVGGIFLGRFLRTKKDAKDAMAANDTNE